MCSGLGVSSALGEAFKVCARRSPPFVAPWREIVLAPDPAWSTSFRKNLCVRSFELHANSDGWQWAYLCSESVVFRGNDRLLSAVRTSSNGTYKSSFGTFDVAAGDGTEAVRLWVDRHRHLGPYATLGAADVVTFELVISRRKIPSILSAHARHGMMWAEACGPAKETSTTLR
jgi:hypothetical protein